MCAASPSINGGLRGLVPLRMMLGNIGVHVIPQQLTVPQAGKAFDERGQLIDEQRASTLDAIAAELVRVSQALRR